MKPDKERVRESKRRHKRGIEKTVCFLIKLRRSSTLKNAKERESEREEKTKYTFARKSLENTFTHSAQT
jgi:hypothetical protein